MSSTPVFSIKTFFSKSNSLNFLSTLVLLFFLGLPTNLHSKTTLQVGVYNNKPTIFVDDDGVVSGLFIDILENIARQEGWELEYVVGDFTEIFSGLKEGSLDLLPAVAFSKEREKFIDYNHTTVMANWAELYTPTNLKITSLTELEGKKIGVKQDDIHFQALKDMVANFNISCRFLEVDEYVTVFEMLQTKYIVSGRQIDFL